MIAVLAQMDARCGQIDLRPVGPPTTTFLFPAALLTNVYSFDPKLPTHDRLVDWNVGNRARDRVEMVWVGW